MIPTCAVMSQTIFRFIDKILANAAVAGLKIIVVPINNWQEVDGVPTYLQVHISAAHSPAFTTGLCWCMKDVKLST